MRQVAAAQLSTAGQLQLDTYLQMLQALEAHFFCVRRRLVVFFFSSIRRHTSWTGDWSSDVCSSDLSWRAARLRAPAPDRQAAVGAARRQYRSEERREGKSVDLGGRRIIKKKKKI